MMLPLLLALQVVQADTLPQVTLAEALREATTYDPNYVQAAGFVAEATWIRRAAMLVFVLPSVTVSADFTGSTTPSFNFGTNSLSNTIVTARIDARYELFTGGRKIADYQFATAQLQSTVANEVGANFLAAAETEATFLRCRRPAEPGRGRPAANGTGGVAACRVAFARAVRRRGADRLAASGPGADARPGGPPAGAGRARRGARRAGAPGRTVGGRGRRGCRHPAGPRAPDFAGRRGADRARAESADPDGGGATPGRPRLSSARGRRITCRGSR